MVVVKWQHITLHSTCTQLFLKVWALPKQKCEGNSSLHHVVRWWTRLELFWHLGKAYFICKAYMYSQQMHMLYMYTLERSEVFSVIREKEIILGGYECYHKGLWAISPTFMDGFSNSFLHWKLCSWRRFKCGTIFTLLRSETFGDLRKLWTSIFDMLRRKILFVQRGKELESREVMDFAP